MKKYDTSTGHYLNKVRNLKRMKDKIRYYKMAEAIETSVAGSTEEWLTFWKPRFDKALSR